MIDPVRPLYRAVFPAKMGPARWFDVQIAFATIFGVSALLALAVWAFSQFVLPGTALTDWFVNHNAVVFLCSAVFLMGYFAFRAVYETTTESARKGAAHKGSFDHG